MPRSEEVRTIYIGGRGPLQGALFAVFLPIGFQESFREPGAWRRVMFGVLLILVALFACKGLWGLERRLW